jgi:hypothetical protein
MHQGSPSPRKTLTELEPVMLPIELSAVGSWSAAMREASVSGSDVPSATRLMAATDGGMPMQHERTVVVSSRKKVMMPIRAIESTKHGYPIHSPAGGRSAPSTFHTTETRCRAQSEALGCGAWQPRDAADETRARP